ncbi:hypothetical protein [Lysinibacillus fusiformis]|uniref:hypothetical protein n=1 Tax=Lysinibacillus fusiformis TaxID=28031 RepID=UPI001248520E|nr:hypothetical protein [Lysinibacillus fusiformis]KAB0443978.1 hypothetical protein CH314_10275 [Lysinibacillus fusiformis]
MPIENKKLNTPDLFVMNEDKVNECIASYLNSKGFKHVHYLTGRTRGVDVYGKKGNLEVFVESKGSHANDHSCEIVFDDNQLWDHLCKQVCKLMVYRDDHRGKKIILVAANPDNPRIKKYMNKIEGSIEDLKIVKMWVKENCEVIVNVPKSIEEGVLELL